MAYIGGQPEPGCLFCRVLADPAKDEENYVLARPAGALVMLNKFPYNSGHLMIAPVRHTGELAELAADEIGAVMSALQRMLGVLREVMTPDGFNIGANLGRTAGAGMPDHVHFHVVPRWNGDTNFMPVLAETKVINEHLLATAVKVRAALAAG